MKALLVLILAAAIGYVAYEFAYPPIADLMKFTKHVPKEEPKKEVLVVEAPKPKPQPKPEPKPEPVPEMKPEPKPEPKPEMPKVAMPAEPAPDPTGFVPPVFPPVDQVTQNWAVIPASYFTQPRQITMKKDLDITMKMGAGSSKASFKAGGKVFVVGQSGANLIIGSAPGSAMRGEVAMDDTDFKDVFTAAYEQSKVIRTEQARKAHAYQLAAADRAKNAPAAGGKGAAGGGSNAKPEKDKDGAYPILIASMKAGEVTEVKPDNIKSWGDVNLEKIDGNDYWTINVKYETQTMFGKFETEAQARIKNGKVDKWVYTGSGEVVP
jgi:hypothetical protein